MCVCVVEMFSSKKRVLTSNRKQFRSDILIAEQVNIHLISIELKMICQFVNLSLKLNYLKKIEDELGTRRLSHRVIKKQDDQNDLFEFLFKNDTINYTPTKENDLRDFDFYEDDEHFDLNLQNDQTLIHTYKKNLIRCHVKTINKEKCH